MLRRFQQRAHNEKKWLCRFDSTDGLEDGLDGAGHVDLHADEFYALLRFGRKRADRAQSRASGLHHAFDQRLKIGCGNAVIAALKEFGVADRGRLGSKTGNGRALSDYCIEAGKDRALLRNLGIAICKEGLNRPDEQTQQAT